ncbi:hypothetical protein [Nostoc sp. C110]
MTVYTENIAICRCVSLPMADSSSARVSKMGLISEVKSLLYETLRERSN